MSITTLRPSRDAKTAARWAAHAWLAKHSSRVGAKSCMHARPGVGAVKVSRTAGKKLHVSGVLRCGSVHACSGCAPVIREGRAGEVDQGVNEALTRLGWTVFFVTATVSHHLGDHLPDVRALVHDAWRAMMAGRGGKDWREANGYEGQIRVSETTYGVNGFHPHIHAVIMFRTDPGDGAMAQLGYRFGQAVSKLGGWCDVNGAGWVFDRCQESGNVAGYLAKVDGGWGVGQELARGDVKSGRRKGLSMWELLTLAVNGDGQAAQLFGIYERATAGKRFMVWSRGLKAKLAVPETTDEDLLEVAPDDAVEAEWFIPVAEWHRMVCAGRLGAALIWFSSAPIPPGGAAWVDG